MSSGHDLLNCTAERLTDLNPHRNEGWTHRPSLIAGGTSPKIRAGVEID